VALAVRGGLGPPEVFLFAVAVFAGELSIGWSNDAFDADRDAAGGRTDKPIVAGIISRRAVSVAAGASLVVAVVLCFVIGPATGTINAVMLAAGWAYNAGLKSTLASGLMYVIGFGLIPGFAASTLPGQPWARPWTLVAAALLGVGGHFANVLPDLAADRAADVSGLPQRVAAGPGGPTAVRLTAIALLLAASTLIVLAPGRPYGWPALTGLAGAAVLAVVGLRGSGRVPFYAALGIAAVDVALFVSAGAGLVRA
jgi:4-hydroxybenzoate polyprenyltransferase